MLINYYKPLEAPNFHLLSYELLKQFYIHKFDLLCNQRSESL